MKYIVLDLEMNQPSGKIIEIGAVCLDIKTGKMFDPFQILVKIDEEVSPEITELTGITSDMLNEEGVDLVIALRLFWTWVETCQTKNISSWGIDYYLLTEESKKLGVIYPNKLRFLNIKEFASVFRSCYPAAKQKGGLKTSMELFGLQFEGEQHQALDDAEQAARLLFLLKENIRKFLAIQDMLKDSKI